MATASVTNSFVASTTASSSAVNTNFSDLVTFLNGSVVHVDGSKAMTADLPMGTNKVTGLGAPTADTDAATKKYVDDEITASDGEATTYEVLSANGDVGSGASQVAQGSHTHAGYAAASHVHSYYESGDTILAAQGGATTPGVAVGASTFGIGANNAGGYIYLIANGSTVLSGNGSNELYASGIVVGSGNAVYASSTQIVKSSSSERYKDNIDTDVRDELAAIAKQIAAIKFDWKEEVSDFGSDISFWAEQAAEVDPRLVVFDEEGRPDDVRERALLACLFARVEQIAEAVGV